MDFTKYQDKLTNEEIIFLEKIFEDEEVKENFKNQNKITRNRFIYLYIPSWISSFLIIIGTFLGNNILIIIGFVLLFLFLILGSFLWHANNQWIFENYKTSQIIFKKIFAIFSSNGIYTDLILDEYIQKSNIAKVLNTIRTLLFQFSIWKNIHIIWIEDKKTQKIRINNKQQTFSTYFLNYIINIEWKNFENITFTKKWENKKNFYAWIIIIVIITTFLIWIFIKYYPDIENIFNNDLEIISTIFATLCFAIIWTIKEYIQLKNQHNQENNEFLKNFDIISENPNTIYSLNTNIFEHFSNLSKIDKNFTIIFAGNNILFRKKITKTPYFHNSSDSVQENISQYIKFYLEMKEIFYILSKI